MSVKLLSSGGGSVTIADPASTASNFTLNPPLRSGNLAVDGPAFSAYQSSAQSFSASTWTKIQFQTKEFDTNAAFDNATNHRFQPTVSGYYQVSGAFTNATILAQVGLSAYKNGSPYKRLYNGVGGGNTSTGAGSCIVYLNGSTDYVELYGYTTSAQNAYAFADSTYFQAALVRAA